MSEKIDQTNIQPNIQIEKKVPTKKTIKKKDAVEKITNGHKTTKSLSINKQRNSKNPIVNKPKTPVSPNYPRHSISKSLRIPKAILDQNAGRECSELDAATFLGVGNTGPFGVEISSTLKYGLLERPGPRQIKPTELAKRILRPQSSEDELKGLREGVLNAPIISDVYKHYRGENLPDRKFFENALTDTFKIPTEKLTEFIEIFVESLTTAKLIEKTGDKYRIIDIASENTSPLLDTNSEIKKLSKGAFITSSDSCFVMMPFSAPLGDYYNKIYEPAIRKAGLNPVRADNDIFGTGKIVDQIWNGITLEILMCTMS